MSELVENDTSLAYYRTIWILAVILGENCARSYARLLINWMSAADLSHFQYQCVVSYGYIQSLTLWLHHIQICTESDKTCCCESAAYDKCKIIAMTSLK